MGEVEREKERLNFEALSPSPESMSGLSASLWGCPQTKELGCWGRRGRGRREDGRSEREANKW